MAMYEEYQTKMQQYEQKSSTWTPAVLETKQRELMEIESRLQQTQQSLQQELQQLQQNLQAPIVEKANKSAALQKATASYKEAYAIALSDDGKIDATDGTDSKITVDGIAWTCNTDGTLSTTSTIDGYSITVTSGVVSVTK